MQLENYTCGEWVKGSGKQSELIDAITGDLVGTTSSGGLDFGRMLAYGREVGGPPPAKAGRRRLLQMTFPERG
jgi:oxepin-CoA hydrolase / 3-oxo-5,6-dehydrosuberyl-CoA semialdehyde dehydrogenase